MFVLSHYFYSIRISPSPSPHLGGYNLRHRYWQNQNLRLPQGSLFTHGYIILLPLQSYYPVMQINYLEFNTYRPPPPNTLKAKGDIGITVIFSLFLPLVVLLEALDS